MDLGRFLVEAVVVSGASPTELARSHPISRSSTPAVTVSRPLSTPGLRSHET